MADMFMEPPNIYLAVDVADFAFSPTADCLALGLADNTLELHRYSGEETRLTVQCPAQPRSLRLTRFAPSGTQLFCGSAGGLQLLDVQTGQSVREGSSPGQPFECCFVSEHALAVCFDEGTLNVFDTRTFTPIYGSSLEQLGGAAETGNFFSALLPSRDRALLFAPCSDGNLYTFDLRRPAAAADKLFARTAGYDEELTAVAALEGQLVCGTSSGNLQLYKWGLFGQYVDRLPALAKEVGCLAAVDAETLAVANDDGRVRLWRFNPHRVCALEPHAEDGEPLPIERIDVSRCRRILASIAHDRAVRFYDLTDLEAFEAAEGGEAGPFQQPRQVRAQMAGREQRDFFEGLEGP